MQVELSDEEVKVCSLLQAMACAGMRGETEYMLQGLSLVLKHEACFKKLVPKFQELLAEVASRDPELTPEQQRQEAQRYRARAQNGGRAPAGEAEPF